MEITGDESCIEQRISQKSFLRRKYNQSDTGWKEHYHMGTLLITNNSLRK